MINHIGKYNDAQAIQDALDAGTLANPYVAMTSAGTIDYNSLQPTPPAPATMGTWSDDGQGVYTFQITVSPSSSAWTEEVKIGELLGVYSDGNYGNLDVMLSYDQPTDTWHMVFYAEEASNTPEYDFEPGVSYIWESGVMTDPEESNSTINPDWDGVNTFTIPIAPGFLTTINPPYPAGE